MVETPVAVTVCAAANIVALLVQTLLVQMMPFLASGFVTLLYDPFKTMRITGLSSRLSVMGGGAKIFYGVPFSCYEPIVSIFY